MQKYLVNTAGMHANVASGIMTAALFVFMLIQPLIGALSDKIGRRTSMLCFGSLAAIFYRSYSLSITKRFLALCRFWSGDVCPADREFLYFNQWNTEG